MVCRTTALLGQAVPLIVESLQRLSASESVIATDGTPWARRGPHRPHRARSIGGRLPWKHGRHPAPMLETSCLAPRRLW